MPEPSIRICAVILHYGDPSLTERVRRQLLQADPALHGDIRVLDNAAPLPFAEAWVRLPQNAYWAGGLQWTATRLLADEPDYTHLWFLNNDISFAAPGSILEFAAQRLRWISSGLGPVGVYSPSALRNPYHPQMIRNPDRQFRSVHYVDGIAPLFDLAALRDAGGVDLEGNPYGYGVDIVTSLRLREAGYAVVVDHQLALRHTYHSTARTVNGFMDRAARAEAAYLAARLGPDYRERLALLQRDCTEHDRP